MSNSLKNIPMSLSVLSVIVATLSLSASITYADIVEIPPEEMTESYIRDTTVIVRQRAPEQASDTNMAIRVSPIDEPFEDGDKAKESSDRVQRDLEQVNLSADSQENAYRQATSGDLTFRMPSLDPDRSSNDEYLREVLGLQPGAPIDYNNLTFPDSGGTQTFGDISATSTSNQFEIVIPNSNGLRTESFNTPNGEFGINVTPDGIRLQINRP
ncbi:MAG: hypothetical protein P1U57_11155 [Oleibacter sp.]|nr:hypothetical protein [Thalassolituus sp.]